MKAASSAPRRRLAILAGAFLVLVLVWAVFHGPIHRSLGIFFLLNASSPRQEAFFDLAKQTADPVDLLNRCWATGKIPHRQLVATFLNANVISNPPWFAQAEPLIRSAAFDADESVRELALAIMATQHSPLLLDCARAQLKDADPMLRLLGLEYLRKTDPRRAVPIAITLLDDPDLRVVASAEVALMRWSGQDFGVRARMAVAAQEGEHAGEVFPADAELIRRGVAQRKQWWQLHAKEYPAELTATGTEKLQRIPVGEAVPDFSLKDLNGHKIRLRDFRGKVVLLNFWATWCSACLKEIPELIALQKDLGSKIAIVGVALDGVPDEEGEQADAQAGNSSDARDKVHAKVARAVKARGINYTVLLDPHSLAGRQFNGGELPTTVILDAAGHLRRRFIGERSLKVFEAMIDEAQSR